MKVIFDLLPLALFFAAYEAAKSNSVLAAQWATKYLGVLVSGGVIAAKDAPVLLATAVCVLATLLMIAVMKLRGQHIDKLLWANVVIITVLGALTLWFHNDTFIKWKPTMIYWVMGLVFGMSELVTGKIVLQSMMQKEVDLPVAAWRRLSVAWAAFFIALGLLNLYVAFNFSTDTWVNFKLFGCLGLMMVFSVGQFFYISKLLPPAGAAGSPPSVPSKDGAI